MPAALGALNSRFKLESHDHDGDFIAALPYRNVQYEQMLNVSGQSFRCEIPYRGYSQVNQSNLYPGKHELWFYDNKVSQDDPVFAGPLWDATPASSTGVLSCAAQDPLSYLAKRELKTNKVYSAQGGADIIINLIAYVNSIRSTQMTTNKVTSNAQTMSPTYRAIDRNFILDLIDATSTSTDGVDFFFRTVGASHVLQLYGGKIKPAAALSNTLEYGGNMDGYSVQYNAQAIGNDYDIANSNNVIGNAVDAANQTAYDALYQIIERGSHLSNLTALNNSATSQVKATATTKIIPALVSRVLTPIKDFDFGSQFTVIINDEYVQYNNLIRVVGWQNTISQGDKLTTVIYTKDTAEVA